MTFIHLPFFLHEKPFQRWQTLFQYPQLKPAISELQLFLTELTAIIQKQKLSWVLKSLSQRYRRKLASTYPDYLEEFNGLCTVLRCSCDILLMLQFIYEFGARCTSIVFPNYAGSLFHFRTLDWQMSFLRKCMLCLDVYDQNELQYSNLTFLGYIGMYTGQRPFRFSLSLNYRPLHFDHQHNRATLVVIVLKNIFRPFQNYQLNGLAIRKAMETCSNYQDIVTHFQSIKFSAPCYLMICGISEACRIVRSFEPSVTYPFTRWYTLKKILNDKENSQQVKDEILLYTLRQGLWTTQELTTERNSILIQTNMDPAKYHFLKYLEFHFPSLRTGQNEGILLAYSRWKYSERCVTLYRNKRISFDTLIKKLLQGPIINRQTIFWALFQPEKGSLIGNAVHPLL